MRRQQAFEGNHEMLKGGLHCHTTRSDGKCSPEETIRLHHAKGYDFLAITDHRIYNYKNFVPELPITIIPGMEFDNTFFQKKGLGFRCFHTVCIGPSKEDGNGYNQDEYFESGTAANQEGYQEYLDRIHEKNNLTIYCHPEWSSTPTRYFQELKGDFAMEIWNSSAAMSNDMDRDASYWDDLLGQGRMIYGVAVDDGHELEEHCNGWVMVNAENNINSILKALKAGAFYSSCGPEIYDFYVKDDIAVIECSPVSKIRIHCDMHPTRIISSPDGTLTHVEMELKGSYAAYLRATIIDENGKYAWTNPIFL